MTAKPGRKRTWRAMTSRRARASSERIVLSSMIEYPVAGGQDNWCHDTEMHDSEVCVLCTPSGCPRCACGSLVKAWQLRNGGRGIDDGSSDRDSVARDDLAQPVLEENSEGYGDWAEEPDLRSEDSEEIPDLDSGSESGDEGERIEDGGGCFSDADWLSGAREECPALRELCGKLMRMAESWNVGSRVVAGFEKGGPEMFSEEEVADLRRMGQDFVSKHGEQASVEVEEGQPFVLDLLSACLKISGDLDVGLPDILRKGVPAGVFETIAPCAAYDQEDRERKLREPCGFGLETCEENWRSADVHAVRVKEELDKEVKAGWMEEWEHGLEAAYERWGEDRVAVGKLALVVEPGRDARLVGDTSVAGVSPSTRFPNRMRHPRVRDLKRALARCKRIGGRWVAITLDVSVAHKRMKVAEVDGGLGFFQMEGVLYRCLTCFFGASYSAFWWGRVSGALTRLVHRLLG